MTGWPNTCSTLLKIVQEYANQWLWTYNNERPKMAIGGITSQQKLAAVA
jgi:putative transposase